MKGAAARPRTFARPKLYPSLPVVFTPYLNNSLPPALSAALSAALPPNFAKLPIIPVPFIDRANSGSISTVVPMPPPILLPKPCDSYTLSR